MKITVCMGSSCFARGNMENLEFIEGCINEGYLDAEVELLGSRCEGKCAGGPNIIVDGQEYQNVNIEMLKKILKK